MAEVMILISIIQEYVSIITQNSFLSMFLYHSQEQTDLLVQTHNELFLFII